MAARPQPKGNMTRKNHHKPEWAIVSHGTGRMQTFSLVAPSANRVELVGEFTQWELSPISLQKGVDAVWRVTLPLPAGLHQYRFIMDGEQQDDPECLASVLNSTGGWNSVCLVV